MEEQEAVLSECYRRVAGLGRSGRYDEMLQVRHSHRRRMDRTVRLPFKSEGKYHRAYLFAGIVVCLPTGDVISSLLIEHLRTTDSLNRRHRSVGRDVRSQGDISGHVGCHCDPGISQLCAMADTAQSTRSALGERAGRNSGAEEDSRATRDTPPFRKVRESMGRPDLS